MKEHTSVHLEIKERISSPLNIAREIPAKCCVVMSLNEKRVLKSEP